MKLNLFKLCLSILAIFSFATVNAQSSVNTSGGDISSQQGSVSYSVGQIVYTTNTGANTTISQGVQQPFEISEILSVDDFEDIQLVLSAFPNPTDGQLTLLIEDLELSNLNFHVYDMTGKVIDSQKITSYETHINLENQHPSTYILKVTLDNQELKSFKILKK